MKNFKSRLVIIPMMVLLFSISVCAYGDNKEIFVPVPGKLKSLLDKKEYLTITDLTIKGEVNDKDLKTLENLVNIQHLDMSEAKGSFTYFPTFTNLTALLLPIDCRNNNQTIKGEYVYVSDGIRNNTSLTTIFMPGDIASRLGAMPNLKKVGLYNYDIDLYGDNYEIDTLFVFNYIRDDLYHGVGKSFNHYVPHFIVDLTQKLTILNTYDPERKDYKGINVLPVLESKHEVKTPEILDLSDVMRIPSRYFENGTMKKVVFSEQLRFVGTNAFESCKNLTEVTFPGKTVSLKMDEWAFKDCPNLKYVHFLGTVNLRGTAYGNHCVVEFDKPSDVQFTSAHSPFDHFVFNAVPTQLKLGGEYGTKVGDVLSYIEVPANTMSSFTKFVDEEYILEKGRKTKSYTLNLEKPGTILSNLPLNELDIIDSLTIVGFLYDTDMTIFDKCKRLSYLDLGRAVITYSPETLREERQKMEAFKAIFAMAGAVADAKYDNFEMSALDHAYVKAFEQLAKGASSVTAADDNCIIPSGSFSNRTQLKKVILPYRAKHIGNNVLSNCPKLESVELPLYLETIRKESFMQCPKLKDLKFPSTLNYIGESSFKGCNSIEVVDLSQCNFNIGYNTYAKWECAFKDCSNLKEIHLPQGVKQNKGWDYGYIEHNVKRPYALKVYIPATWEEFGSLNNWGNAELHFESPTAPGHFGHALNGCNVIIYCPKGSTTSYYNAVGGKIDNVKIIEQ